MDALDAADVVGFVFCNFVTFPKLDFWSWFAEKKYLAMFLLIGIGIEEKNGLFLLDATEIE